MCFIGLELVLVWRTRRSRISSFPRSSGVATRVRGVRAAPGGTCQGRQRGEKRRKFRKKIRVKIQIVSYVFACKKNKALRPACTYRQLLRWVLGCIRFELRVCWCQCYANFVLWPVRPYRILDRSFLRQHDVTRDVVSQCLINLNLRRKGGKFDHRPGRPKVLLRHWARYYYCYY